MKKGRLSQAISEKAGFIIITELTGGPNFSYHPIESFLSKYQDSKDAFTPSGDFNFVAITLPQSPGGSANIQPSDVICHLKFHRLLGQLDVLAHVTCKDHNTDAIISNLVRLRQMGIDSVLAMTGDKPTSAKGVFELDSIGLLRLIRQMNHQAYITAPAKSLGQIRSFNCAAAVSPFKYTESSLMQQYYKMEKKIRCGADFLITQMGWDWKKSVELFQYLKYNNIDIPVIGYVYMLSTLTPAPRLMHDIKLPGCFVSDDLLAKVQSEKVDDHIERTAQQIAMYKSIGAAGVDVGGVHDFEIFKAVLERAAQIGNGWEEFKDNLSWPAKENFYLYDEAGRQRPLGKADKTLKQRFFDFSHSLMLDPKYPGFGILKKTMSLLGAKNKSGAIYKLFNAVEKWFKYLVFDCKECGDCYLSENFGLCTIGGCEKGMDNAPCGDSTVDGMCGNNLDRICIGELIYDAASAKKGGREKLRATINKPRNPALEHTSSILNYLFAKDHTMKNAIISIGETIHASIPKTGKIMAELAELGADAYINESDQLNYIKALIESQVDDGADYIAVNLDAFGEDDPQTAVNMMREYVKLVQKWSDGVPICIDSSDDKVLKAGLEQWYAGRSNVKIPLINSVKTYTMEKFLPLKKDYNFNFIGLLVSETAPTGPGGSHSVEELYGLAVQIFERATGKYGFLPEQIFFDSTVFPLAIDMPMEPNVPGYTYRTFETIKKIRKDPKMKGVHCSLGISNSVRDLPGRRTGVCRAYVAKAMEYGLDAGIINVAHHYGSVEPAPELMELVNAYAVMDGSAEKMNTAMMLMAKFCQDNRKPVAKNQILKIKNKKCGPKDPLVRTRQRRITKP